MRPGDAGSDWLVQVTDWGQVSLVEAGPGSAPEVVQTLFVGSGDGSTAVALARRWRDLREPCILGLNEAAGTASGPAGGSAIKLHREAPRGSTLEEVLAGHGPLNEAMVAALFADLLPCLQRCHKDGLILGSLSPDRLYLCPPALDQVPAVRCHDVALLPLVLLAGQPMPAPEQSAWQQVLGAAEVIAPEVANGMEPAAASDVYSLCAIMSWALLGRHVHGGATPLLIRHAARDGPGTAAVADLSRCAPTLAEPLLRGLSANAWLRSGVPSDLLTAMASVLGQPQWRRISVAAGGGPWAIGSPLIPLAAYAGATSYADRFATADERRTRGRRSSRSAVLGAQPGANVGADAAPTDAPGPSVERVRKARLDAALSELDTRRALADHRGVGRKVTVAKLVIVLVTMAVCAVIVWVGMRRTQVIAGSPAQNIQAAPEPPMVIPKPRSTPVTDPID